MRFSFDPERKRDHAEDRLLRRYQVERGRRLGGRVDNGCRRDGPISLVGGRDKNSKHSSGEISLPCHGKVQLALGLPVEKRPVSVSASASEQTQQNVIVAVKERYARSRCHHRSSISGGTMKSHAISSWAEDPVRSIDIRRLLRHEGPMRPTGQKKSQIVFGLC